MDDRILLPSTKWFGDEAEEFSNLLPGMLQGTGMLVEDYGTGDRMKIRHLDGTVEEVTILGFNTSAQAGRIVYFELDDGYGSFDLLIDGDLVVELVKRS